MEENNKGWCKYLPLLGLILLGLIGYLMNYAGKNSAKNLALAAKSTAQEALDANNFTFASAEMIGSKLVIKGDAKDKATKDAACAAATKALNAKSMIGLPGVVHSISCELLPQDANTNLQVANPSVPTPTPAPATGDAQSCQNELNSIAASAQVGFAKGGAAIISGNDILDKIAETAKKCANFKIEIGGHTDSGGDDAMNMNLSQLRANQVRNYLTQKGVAADKLIAKGYGETKPLVQDNAVIGVDSPERAKNRRTEFTILAQ